MKQHIKPEQLEELSPQGKVKLRAWWKPQSTDFINDKHYQDGVSINTAFENIYTKQDVLDIVDSDPDLLPLLSIGQMIEFLEFNGELEHTSLGIEIYWKKGELADALWEAVKKLLEAKEHNG